MKYFSFLILLILMGCMNSSVETDKTGLSKDMMIDTLNLPLDTTKILKYFSSKLSDEVLDIPSDLSLDTFELTHVSYACDCQDWVLTKEYEEWKSNPNLFQKDDDYSAFDTDNYGFFLEAADQNVKIPDEFHSFNNRIRVIGTVKDDSTYHTESMVPKRKQVITFYSYEIIKPATVYGPLYYSGQKVLPDDSTELILRSTIEIR